MRRRPPTWPSCTTRAAPRQGPRWRSPRRASVRSWPSSPLPPGERDGPGRPWNNCRPAPSSMNAVARERSCRPNADDRAVGRGRRHRRRRRAGHTVRRSQTNQDGETNDVRFVKAGVARAIRTLRAFTNPEPAGRVVPLSPQMIGLRFTAAALVAGVESRVTAHSGRVGLASELTSRGASTTDVMLAGNWRTSALTALRIAAVPVLARLAIVRDGDAATVVVFGWRCRRAGCYRGSQTLTLPPVSGPKRCAHRRF